MKRAFSGLLFLAFLFGCGTTQNFNEKSVRPATDTPVAFEPKSGVSFDDTSCKSPLVDPRSGVEIIMVVAHDGKGDYRVPSGLYGLSSKELLRINCSNGEVIGIVNK
ncbi:hypothetical protein C8P64_1500 [Christiangramia gaetbulicola]|uniref:Lipoprotein n=1 Tax=Christiangramia gaetbulicola TaxID=703340 RepID=A0A2T6AGQ8_9FLAO|nr:hypothetical protein [Christiangramia gaetbulicola]PTX42977.1 hypothetical protein C8P64_1500 [Christiangramia gaetbulicola]